MLYANLAVLFATCTDDSKAISGDTLIYYFGHSGEMHLNTMTTRFGSGQAVQRLEDDQLLKGAGVYTSDVAPSGQTYISFYRSPYAHARVLKVDTTAAKSMPGVRLVVTGKELADAGMKPMPRPINFTRADGSAATATPCARSCRGPRSAASTSARSAPCARRHTARRGRRPCLATAASTR